MLVYCGQTVRRIKMKLGTQVGVGPGQYCVRWGFSSPRNRAQQPHFRNLRAQALAWQVLRTRSVWGSLAVGGGMPVWSVSQVQRLIRTKILKVYSFRDITCKYDIQELLKFTNCSSFQYLPHISLQYGELWPTSGWHLLVILGHPCKFQPDSRLGSVTARQSSSGRQPNFVALNRGRHLYLAERPSHWALAHISSLVYFIVLYE